MNGELNSAGVVVPTIGRIVHVRFKNEKFNSSDVAPAIVTASWNKEMPMLINCRALVDGDAAPIWLTSIPHESAGNASGNGRAVWFWPPRT